MPELLVEEVLDWRACRRLRLLCEEVTLFCVLGEEVDQDCPDIEEMVIFFLRDGVGGKVAGRGGLSCYFFGDIEDLDSYGDLRVTGFGAGDVLLLLFSRPCSS